MIPATLFVAPAAVLFTLAGTGLGALVVEERWAAPAALRLSVAPGAGGAVRLSYRFPF